MLDSSVTRIVPSRTRSPRSTATRSMMPCTGEAMATTSRGWIRHSWSERGVDWAAAGSLASRPMSVRPIRAENTRSIIAPPSLEPAGEGQRCLQLLVHPQQLAAHPRMMTLGGSLGPAADPLADPREDRTIAQGEARGQPPPPASVGREQFVVERHHGLVGPRIALAAAAT